jgi:hypothetical protein
MSRFLRRVRHAVRTLRGGLLEITGTVRRVATGLAHPPRTLEERGWEPIRRARYCDAFTRVEFTATHARGEDVRMEHRTGAWLVCTRAELEQMVRLEDE